MRTFNDIVKYFLKEIIGDKGVSLYNLIWNKKNVSEFKIAEELKLTINQVRNLLYQFSTYNLVYSTRKKDREKGWYIYYWTINFNEIRLLLMQRKKTKLSQLYNELDAEREQKFFICNNDGTKLELEEAMEYNFKCPECESVLINISNEKRINAIKQEIDQIKVDLDNLKNNEFVQEVVSQQVEEEERKEKRKKRGRKIRKKKKVKKIKKLKKKKIIKKIKKYKKFKKQKFKLKKIKKKSKRK